MIHICINKDVHLPPSDEGALVLYRTALEESEEGHNNKETKQKKLQQTRSDKTAHLETNT